MAKKVLLILLTFLMLACGNTKRANKWYNIGNGDTSISMIDTLDRQQFDSLCYVDIIARDYKHEWLQLSARDYETKKPLVKYLFIKNLRDSSEVIYTLNTLNIPFDTLFVVEKRITYYQNND